MSAATRKCAVVNELGGKLTIEEQEVPTPGPFDALVKVKYSGVCHTDLHAAHGDWPVNPAPPFAPGHEGVGEVVAVGDRVTRVKVGDIVGNAWLASACGECEFCEEGWETLCPNQENSGYSVDGSFSQYMLVDSRYCPRIPDAVDLAAAAPILCAGVTVYKGLKVTDTKPGDWVLISGIGGLGHIAVQYAVAMGRRVVAIDIDDDKLQLAKKMAVKWWSTPPPAMAPLPKFRRPPGAGCTARSSPRLTPTRSRKLWVGCAAAALYRWWDCRLRRSRWMS